MWITSPNTAPGVVGKGIDVPVKAMSEALGRAFLRCQAAVEIVVVGTVGFVHDEHDVESVGEVRGEVLKRRRFPFPLLH